MGGTGLAWKEQTVEMKKIDKTFTEAVTSWFRENKRRLPWREDRQPYPIWVSEIMLQQTRVEAVREYYRRWMEALPTVQALAETDEESLLKLWQGLGYYNRVRNMQKAARQIMEAHNGEFPRTYADILALPGIGEYTAGAIASNCFDEPVPAVDGNVLRVLSRLTEDEADITKQSTKKKYAEMLREIYPKRNCGDFTQGLMEIGAIVCVPSGAPKCEICPIRDYCGAFAQGTMLDYPIKAKKKERKIVEMTVFLLECEGCMAVQKRKEKGVLHGLYQYPNVAKTLAPEEALALAEEWRCSPAGLSRSSAYRHIFTHVEWHMTGYYIPCGRQGTGADGDFLWVNESKMEKEIPLPSAFAYF